MSNTALAGPYTRAESGITFVAGPGLSTIGGGIWRVWPTERRSALKRPLAVRIWRAPTPYRWAMAFRESPTRTTYQTVSARGVGIGR
jgi:hypothetical protein